MDWCLVGTPTLGVYVDYPPSNRAHGLVGIRVPTGVGFLNRGHRRFGTTVPTMI